jgi:lipopolysaccharide transport system permease protein
MSQTEEVFIEAGHSAKNYWRDLWKNRNLLWILARRDLSSRYKQSVVGIGWAVIRPALTTLVMVFVFSQVAKLKGDPGIPYPLMVLAGITIWSFFSNSLTQVSQSILMNANLITKVYFPRLIMPISSVVVGLIDFCIALGLYFVVCIWYGFYPNYQLVFLPFFLFLAFLAALGFGLLFAVVNTRFRDISQLIPFLVQIGFYACPVAYSSRLVENNPDAWWHQFYYFNPMVGIIDGFRWCLLGDAAFFKVSSLYSTISVTLVMLCVSIYYFRKKENSFVDYI